MRKGDAEMVAAAIRTIFAQPTGPAVRDQLDSVAALLSDKFPAVAAMLTDAKPQTSSSRHKISVETHAAVTW